MSWFKRKPTMLLAFASDQYEVFTTDKGRTFEVFEQPGMTQLSLFGDRAHQLGRTLRGAAVMAEEFPHLKDSTVLVVNSIIRLHFERSRGQEPSPLTKAEELAHEECNRYSQLLKELAC
jgi:hypothetical protein